MATTEKLKDLALLTTLQSNNLVKAINRVDNEELKLDLNIELLRLLDIYQRLIDTMIGG